jgi:hypothetical protein
MKWCSRSHSIASVLDRLEDGIKPALRLAHVTICLLLCAANLGGQEFAESLSPDIAKLLVNNKSGPFVTKKAALCLLRLIRKFPDSVPGEEFPQK